MLGRIVKYGAIIFCSFIVGWVFSVVCRNTAPYTLDWSINMADVLSVLVDVFLACVVAQLINKSIHNSRVEKDFLISELNSFNTIIVDLERVCSRETILSLPNTNYDIGRSRKVLQRMWKITEEVDRSFHLSHQKDFDEILDLVKKLGTKLTDAKYFQSKDGFQPIKIAKNHIYLNNSVKPEIDKDITNIKERVLQMKVAINKI